MRLRSALAVCALAGCAAGPLAAQPALMSAEWAQGACEAWNRDAALTDPPVETGWVKNDKGSGFKVMHVFRKDCGAAPTAELRIALKGDMALCVYGGKVETTQLDRSADDVMSVDTARWVEMGRGDYGPMRATMFGRLEFVGPRMEAMGNMGPFENFLLLIGKVPGGTQCCPAG
jgi:putative sterol carrier protein